MIKPGDIVQLVWGCCAEMRQNIGRTGTVEHIYHGDDGVCGYDCGYSTKGVPIARFDGKACPASWLIKIDPPGVTKKQEDEAIA